MVDRQRQHWVTLDMVLCDAAMRYERGIYRIAAINVFTRAFIEHKFIDPGMA